MRLARPTFLFACALVAVEACSPLEATDFAQHRDALEIEPGNLVQNPSFEGGSLAGWACYQCAMSTIFRADAPNGSSVAHIVAGTLAPGLDFYDLDDTNPVVPGVLAGDWYQATVYIAASTSSAVGKDAFMVLRVKRPDGGFEGKDGTATIPATGFARVTVRFQIPRNDDMQIYFGQRPAVQNDAVDVDLVTIIKLLPDAGIPPWDAGSPTDDGGIDAGVPDAGTRDSGTPDAGPAPRGVSLKGWSCDAAPMPLCWATLALAVLAARPHNRRQRPL